VGRPRGNEENPTASGCPNGGHHSRILSSCIFPRSSTAETQFVLCERLLHYCAFRSATFANNAFRHGGLTTPHSSECNTNTSCDAHYCAPLQACVLFFPAFLRRLAAALPCIAPARTARQFAPPPPPTPPNRE
jgi:hypothetical protein